MEFIGSGVGIQEMGLQSGLEEIEEERDHDDILSLCTALLGTGQNILFNFLIENGFNLG